MGIALPRKGISRGVDTLETIDKLGDKCVDLLLTDVPYDFDESTKNFLHENFLRLARRAVIVFSPPENQWDFNTDQFLFWAKPISTKNTSKSYSRFVEMVFIYELEEYVWNTQYNWSNYVNILNDKVIGKSNHPFEKPESLVKRLIRLHSKEGDSVFDPFCGSGTIPNMAIELNRVGIGWDIVGDENG